MPDFIPEIYSRLVYVDLDESLVAAALTNNNYEGEITQAGDTVHILTPGEVTVKPYNGPPLDDPETPDDVISTMKIDQQHYFNAKLPKVKKVQTLVNVLPYYIANGGQGMRKVADTFILGKYTDVHPDNIVTPDTQLDETNIHKWFAVMSERFNDKDVPDEERRAVVSNAIITLFKLFFAGKQTDFGTNVTRNGFYGNFEGFKIYKSNNVPTVQEDINADTEDETVQKIMFGHPLGITFAFQIPPDEIEKYKPEKDFGEAVKALVIFGAKMLADGKRNGVLNYWK